MRRFCVALWPHVGEFVLSARCGLAGVGGIWPRGILRAIVSGVTAEWVVYVAALVAARPLGVGRRQRSVLEAQAIGPEDYYLAVEGYRDVLQRGEVEVPIPGIIDVAKRVIVNGVLVHRYAFPANWPPVLFIGAGGHQVLCRWAREAHRGVALIAVFCGAAAIVLFGRGQGVASVIFYRHRFVRRGVGAYRGLAALGVCLCLLVPQALRSAFRAHIDAAERQAGMWLWQHGEPDGVVLDRKPFVAYYSGLTQGWPPPQEGLTGLRKILDQYEAAVLVVDNRYFRRSCQAWFEALQCPPDWLVERARFSGPDGQQVRLLSYWRQ